MTREDSTASWSETSLALVPAAITLVHPPAISWENTPSEPELLTEQDSIASILNINYFNVLVPTSVPLAPEAFAAAEILKTLVLIHAQLHAIQASYVLDIHPENILILADLVLGAVGITLYNSPALKTTEVTIGTAIVTRALHRATKGLHARILRPSGKLYFSKSLCFVCAAIGGDTSA